MRVKPGDKLKDILTSTKLKPTKFNAHVGKCYLCEGVDCMRKNFCYQLTVYQLNATRLNTTLNLTSLGSLLNWFGIQAI